MKKKWERESEGAKGERGVRKGRRDVEERSTWKRGGRERGEGQTKLQNEGERKREERGERGKENSPKSGLPRSCVRCQLRVVSG